ncbi:hypothetical protein BDA96_01G248600 [Sorghum bicolor]|uniref:WRC domain-containing protein n=1 Tax=Sorghum bicolor TaxID=4558 RepID=A0A921V177_SORBI|nr:hypothetical protein BDA96_01G248600 [Sorghum bicolor]
MRIRKRTPAREASPGPPPPPPPPPLQLQQTMEKPQEDEEKEIEEEEKWAILAAKEDDDRVHPAAAASGNRNKNRNSVTDHVPKPEPQEQDAVVARCNRNDGKRWRCKKATVPGYLFCDRHITWSTRKHKPRAKKPKSHSNGVLEPTTIPKKFTEDHNEMHRNAGFFSGF